MKKKLALIVTIISLILSSCSSYNRALTRSKSSESSASVEDVKEKLTQLSTNNISWLANGGERSWIHYTRIPVSGGIDKFRFYSQERWILLEEGHVKRDLTVVMDPVDGTEKQRYILDETGIRAELLELRAKGLSAVNSATPVGTNWEVRDIAVASIDYEIFNALEEYVVAMELVEIEHDGTPCVQITIEYQGDPELRILGLPPSDEKIGKKEVFIYEISTGSRVYYSRAFISKNGQIDEFNSYIERTEMIETLPENVRKEWELSEKELIFLKKLFD